MLDLAGVICLALVAYSVWPPAALAVWGVFLLLASRSAVRARGAE